LCSAEALLHPAMAWFHDRPNERFRRVSRSLSKLAAAAKAGSEQFDGGTAEAVP
jgi:hypothetical protein